MTFILNKIFVKNFYRQQAGFFLFIFLVFFGIIAPSMQLAYHYALIRGMLTAPVFMALVWLAWLGYALKIDRFLTGILEAPEYRFLSQLRALPKSRVFAHFLRIQTLLLLPVSSYALIVAIIGWHQKMPGTSLAILGYIILLTIWGSLRHTGRLLRPIETAKRSPYRTSGRVLPYWSVLVRYLLTANKALLLAIKLFSCGLLYLMLRIQTPADYDLRMPYFAFSLAMFGHGLLLYRCRSMETSALLWYRALPVPVMRRFGQIALFCGMLLLPEMLLLGCSHLIRLTDSLSFIISAYSLLLLLYSMLTALSLTTGDYLKLCLVLFGILYASVLGGVLIASSGFFIFTATVLFVKGY